MLRLRSILRLPDHMITIMQKKPARVAAATVLVSLGVASIRTANSNSSAKESVTPVINVTGGQKTSEEESDTKAKVRFGFEDLAISIESLSKSVAEEETPAIDSERYKNTKEVISTKVKEAATETVKAENLLSEADYSVLLRIVEAEAGGEDMKGKILVANVVMNRVNCSEFPNSVTGVVYERLQFSPVGDGRINTVTVSTETREAVSRALSGEDYSMGAYYFSARAQADPNNMVWFDSSLKRLFRHGAHEFYTFR